METATSTWWEPITEPDILESIARLPTEDELPYDDGEPMETPRHRQQMNTLIESLTLHWADRRGYFVGGNMFLHYDPTSKRRSRGPDVFVMLDVEDRERKSWVVWQENMRFPDVIIELSRTVPRRSTKSSFMNALSVPENIICMIPILRNSWPIIYRGCITNTLPRTPSTKCSRRRPACI